MRNLLNVIIILCLYLNLRCTEGRAQERESGKVDSHTIQFIPLSPSPSSCIPSSKGLNTKSSLRLVHKHGACSPLRSGKAASLEYGDILAQDQARVDSIHSKSSKNFAERLRQSQSTDVPVKEESKLGSGNYLVTIGIGTPKQDRSMIIDTGSDLTWTKCGPKSTNKQVFNPSSSDSFSNIMSSSPLCSNDLQSPPVQSGGCMPPRCCYGITYADNSSSAGYLAKDKFTLTSSDVFDGIHFGCGLYNEIFDDTDGLLGLSRHDHSFPSQTAKTYNNIFSYCLPSSTSYTGHLTFGSAGISESVKYTPIIDVPNRPELYGLDIVGITVGGTKLDIPRTVFSEPGAVIDSGTVTTRLPPKAYAALRSEFKKQMTNYTTISRSVDDFMDTCYDSTGLETMAIPKISFSFGGGPTVELDSNRILYRHNGSKGSKVCLAFAANKNDGDVAIFGSFQQKTLQVVYDKAGGRVGFAPNGCS